MRRPSSPRTLFVFVLLAIVVVYAVGRFWLDGKGSAATEAGMVPAAVIPDED